MNDREKWLLIGIAGFSVITFAAVYVFSLTNLGFSDAFDLNVFQKFFLGNTLIYLVIVGALFAADAALLVWLTNKLTSWDPAIAVTTGNAIAFAAGVVMNLFSTINNFGTFMFFYALGCVYVAHKVWDISGKGVSTMSTVYNASKRLMMIMAVGGLIGGIVITSASADYYQGLLKSSIISFTSGINLANILTKDDVREIVISQELTRDEFVQIATENCNADTTCSQLPPIQKDAAIQTAADRSYQAQTDNREQNVDRVWTAFQERSSLPSLTTDILDRLPFFDVLLNILPILTGLILYSVISTFGQIVVGPIAALLGFFVKK